LLALSACAREPQQPARHAQVEPGRAANDAPDPAQVLEPAPEEAELTTQYRAAPALSSLEGQASYYSDKLSGHKTASGERYRPQALTAAHRTLPMGTVLRVSRRDGTRSVFVRINDRGPFGSERRILDLSRAAFERLGKLRAGVLEVRAEVVAYGKKRK
jgi:rare lipoprotein A